MPRLRPALLVAAAIVMAACSGGGDSTTTVESQATTTTTTSTTLAEDPGTTTTTTEPASTTTTTEAVEASHIDTDVATTVSVGDGWAATPIAQGVKPVIDLDGTGSPAIAWIFERIDGFVAYAAAGEWAPESVKRGYFYGPIDLDFDPDGKPHIVIHDHQADDLDPALGDLTRYIRQDGTWITDIARDDGHDGWDSAIEIGSDGVVHAAGVDPAQFARVEGVEYYRNEGGTWQVTQIGSGPIPYQYNVGLALGPDEAPAITYYNDTDQDLVFASLDGDEWGLEVVADEGDVGKYSSLAFTPDGAPAVTYFRQLSESSGEIVYSTREGEGWSSEVVGEIGAFSEPNARRNSALAFDGQGRPHVLFSDTEGVWHSVRDGDEWATSEVVTAGDFPLGQLVSLAIDAEDVLHAAFYEVTAADPLDGVVVYVTNGG